MNVEGWRTVTIEECCDILDSRRIPINAEEREERVGSIPYYGANGLQGYINDYIFDDDLILIAEDGGYFNEFAKRPIAYRVSGKAWVNNHAHVLKAKTGYCQDTIFYCLEHKDIQPFIVGGTRAKLNQSGLRSIVLDIPELESEQTQIATILSNIDRAIEQTEAIIAKQQRIKTGLMQDLLTKGIDEDGNVRSETTHEFKDSLRGRIPVEWEVEHFGSRVKESAFGPRFPSTAYSKQGNFALLRTTDLDMEGNIRYKQMPLAKLPEPEFSKHVLQNKDLLITRSGTCGVTAVFENYSLPTIPGAFSIRFRLLKNLACPTYIKDYFNWDAGRKTLLDLAEGGVQKNLRGSAINQMLFAFPTIEEQQRIVEAIESIESRINLEREALEKNKYTKTGLMQDLLTGKVRVTELLRDRAEASP